jgi:amino acid adenylation domain-containing protein
LVIALLAVVKSGAAFIPVDPHYPERTITHLLSDSEATLLLTETDWLFGLPAAYEGPVFALDLQLDELKGDGANLPATVQADDLAYILYTSGSTGLPKGVEILQRNIGAYLNWASTHYYNGVTAKQVPWFTSFSFDLSLTSIFTPLLRGDTLVVFPEERTEVILRQIAESSSAFSLVKMTPSHIEVLKYLGVTSFPVERVIAGGEALTDKHIQTLRSLNKDIIEYNEYGPTETTVGCMVEEVPADEKMPTIGVPIPGYRIYILDGEMQLLPPGAWGEIYIGGMGVGRGYHNRAEMSAARFVADRTGDAGRWQEDGRMIYRGRMDEQMKFNGYRIEPAEIAAAIEQMEEINQAVVLLKESANGDKSLAAYYSGTFMPDGGRVIPAFLQQLLPAHMVPGIFVYVADFPLTRNGKLDKQQLLSIRDNGREDNENYQPAVNEIQHKLVNVFEDLLAIQRLSITDNLFSRGLNSLKAIKAQSILDDLYPGKVEIHQIFSHSNVESLSRLLETTSDTPIQEDPELIDL